MSTWETLTSMRDADVRLRIEKTGDNLSLHLSSRAGDLPLPNVMPVEDLSDLRQDFNSTLEQFKRYIGENVQVGLQEAYEALAFLHRFGVTVTSQLLGSAVRDLPFVLELFRMACPLWDDESVAPPLLEIESDAARFFPFEMLPLFSFEFQTKPFTEPQELQQAVRSFLGFSMMIKRTLPNHPLASDLKLWAADQGLPIKFFWYEPLEGAKSEHDFFVAERGAIDMDGPWPVGDLSNPAVIDQLSRHLFDPRWTLDGNPKTIPDQIHHFACHCDTRATSSRDYAIMLSCGEKASYRIRLSDLVASVTQLIGANPPVRVSLPLIFMNACGSSVIEPNRFGSFPKQFLNWRNRGFIGTETRVPDEFAAVFSQHFYTNLIQGLPVGEALRRSKMMLVEAFNNPLGALYTMYADPDLHLESTKNG